MTRPSAVPATGNRERVAFLDEMCRVLSPSTELMVLPGHAKPRLIVPASRRTSAAAVRRYGEPRSLRARMGVRGLSLLLRSGVGGVVLRDRVHVRPGGGPSIESYLEEQLGRELEVSMYVGAPRANRKPVLQLIAPDGSAIGFAKIGISPLARQLVRDERDALGLLADAGLRNLIAPRVLHDGVWEGMPVMVLEPLAVEQKRVPLRAGQLEAAMAEVARVAGVEHLPARDQRLLAEPARAAGRRRPVSRPADAGGSALGAPCARGQGDWSSSGRGTATGRPGTWRASARGLLVWDWERFSTGVPVGFDALHHRLQGEVAPGRKAPAAEAATDLATRSESPLADALLYLAELATRSLTDRQAAAGARLGATSRWLIPAIAAGTAAL